MVVPRMATIIVRVVESSAIWGTTRRARPGLRDVDQEQRHDIGEQATVNHFRTRT